MSRNLDERRVYELMEQPMSRYEPQANNDGYSLWANVLKLAVFLLVLVLLILWTGGQ